MTVHLSRPLWAEFPVNNSPILICWLAYGMSADGRGHQIGQLQPGEIR